jgi:hypothetical protein
MLIPSTVVLEFAVVDQSNKLGIFYSPIKKAAFAGRLGCGMKLLCKHGCTQWPLGRARALVGL